MNKYSSKWSRISAVIFSTLITAVAMNAQTASELKTPVHKPQYAEADHLLDGTSFQYCYQGGGGLEIAFADGKLQYGWISGPRKKTMRRNNPILEKKMWIQKRSKNQS